jgi:hypothetical protein
MQLPGSNCEPPTRRAILPRSLLLSQTHLMNLNPNIYSTIIHRPSSISLSHSNNTTATGKMATKHTNSTTTGQASTTRRLCQELGITAKDFEQVKNLVLQHWWPNLCKSANNIQFYNSPFKLHWFDKNGVLNADDPMFARIVTALVCASASTHLHTCSLRSRSRSLNRCAADSTLCPRREEAWQRSYDAVDREVVQGLTGTSFHQGPFNQR